MISLPFDGRPFVLQQRAPWTVIRADGDPWASPLIKHAISHQPLQSLVLVET